MSQRIKPYPEYKDSGVPWIGNIPAHWKMKRLRELLSPVNERDQPDLPLLSVVRDQGVILRDTTSKEENHNYIPDDLSNYRVVHAGQFCMNKMKAWQGSYGVSKFDGIVSPAYFVFQVRDIWVDFFHKAIRSKAYIPFFTQASDGIRVDQWDLSKTRMREVPFFIPPPDEQTAIVRYLDFIDRRIRRYIQSRQKMIRLLNEQKQAIIHQAVTRGLDPNVRLKPSGVEWLGDVPEHWTVVALSHKYFVELGKMLDEKRITGAYLIPYLRNADVQWGKINLNDLPQMDIQPSEYQRYTVRPGDLLVCEGGDVGRSAFWKGEIPICGFQKALHRVRVKNSEQDDPRFLYYLMYTVSKLGIFLTNGSENTFAHLTCEKLRKYRFPFPPYTEQEKISRYLDEIVIKIDNSILRIKEEVDKLLEYQNRLIADVVTGKIDIRDVAYKPPSDFDLLETSFDIEEPEEKNIAE